MQVHNDSFEGSIINCLFQERYKKAYEIDTDNQDNILINKNNKCLCKNVTIKSTVEFDLTLPEEWDEDQILSFYGSEIGTLELFKSVNDMEIVSIRYPVKDVMLYKQICSYMKIQGKYYENLLKKTRDY